MNTAKVIQFAPRVKAKMEAETPVTASIPASTNWDNLFAESGEEPEYKLIHVLRAMSAAYMVGNRKLGDKLLTECRKNGFARWLQLNKELGDAVDTFDISIILVDQEIAGD